MHGSDTRPPIEFGLLGPLSVTVAGVPVRITGFRPRALLAVLLTAEGRVVSEDALIEALWGDEPPAAARNSLQSHVSRLRSALTSSGDDLAARLRREPGGYRLVVRGDEVDVRRATSLLAEAGRCHDPHDRLEPLRAARALWRGEPLAEFVDLPGWIPAGLAASRARLAELEVTVAEALMESMLEVGRHVEVLPDLEEAAGRDPTRERLQRLLAVALQRSGRAADALTVLRRYRERLADDTGLDPSPELDALERAILGGDPALTTPHGLRPTAVARPPAPPPATPRDTGRDDQASPRHTAGTPLVGRDRDLDQVVAALATSPVVTITGAGGVGKTRLALATLDRLRPTDDRPTVLLELSSLRDGDGVVARLASLLDVRPGPDEPLLAAVLADLAVTPCLLVVDNCEHLLDPVAALLQRIAAAASGVSVLATSRQRLGIEAEQVLPLAPLAVPATPDEATATGPEVDTTPAVQLFVARARRLRPHLELDATTRPLVADLCRRLDGLPLAIELAAAQVGVLGLADLRDRLDDRLDLLARPRDDRVAAADEPGPTALRAVVDRSYELLDEPGREAFATLAVFDGGFTLSAAEHVVGGAPREVLRDLGQLVDASLVTAADDGQGRLRYGMLETLRAYALERLEASSRLEDVRRRHVAWVVELVEATESRLEGPEEARFVATIEREFANIRSARRHAVATGDLDAAARITVALGSYAHWHGDLELWSWARELADGGSLAGASRIAVAGAAAQAAYLQGDLEAAERYAGTGLGAGDTTAAARRWSSMVARHVLAMYRGAFAEAEELADDAAAVAEVSPTWRVVLAGNVALARLFADDVTGARRALEACRTLASRDPAPTARAWLAYVEGEIALVDDPARAAAILASAVDLARSVGATFVAGVANVARASAATRTGDDPEALARFGEAIRHWHRTGMWVQQWTALRNLAELFVDLGALEPTVVLLAAAEAADEAPAVVGSDADRLARLWAQLRAQLPDERLAQLSSEGRAMGRADVIGYALAAIETTLAERSHRGA